MRDISRVLGILRTNAEALRRNANARDSDAAKVVPDAEAEGIRRVQAATARAEAEARQLVEAARAKAAQMAAESLSDRADADHLDTLAGGEERAPAQPDASVPA